MSLLMERRKFKRDPVELVIHCFPAMKRRADGEPFEARARDISPKGVKLISPKYFEVGENIVLRLEKPIARSPLLVKGRIAWMRNSEGAETEIGVEFLHISLYGK